MVCGRRILLLDEEEADLIAACRAMSDGLWPRLVFIKMAWAGWLWSPASGWCSPAQATGTPSSNVVEAILTGDDDHLNAISPTTSSCSLSRLLVPLDSSWTVTSQKRLATSGDGGAAGVGMADAVGRSSRVLLLPV